MKNHTQGWGWMVAVGQAAMVSLAVGQGASLEVVTLGQGVSQQTITAMSADGSTVAGTFRTIENGQSRFSTFVSRPGDGGLVVTPVSGPGRQVPGGLSANGSLIAIAPIPQANFAGVASVLQRGGSTVRFTVPELGISAGDRIRVAGLSVDGDTVVGDRSRLVEVPGGAVTSSTAWRFTRGMTSATELAWPIEVGGGQTVLYNQAQAVGASWDGSRVLLAVRPPLPTANPAPALPYGFVVVDGNGSFTPVEGGTATGISGDGLTVVGRAPRVVDPGRNVATLWFADQPPVRLALPRGAVGSQLFGVNGDGLVSVGAYTTAVAGEVRAMVWASARGARDLELILSRAGVSVPAGVTLRTAQRVSEDGRTIAGFASGPAGQVMLFHATLPEGEVCYANCDGSTASPVLDLNDFVCFSRRLAAGHFYADCDRNGEFTVNDFVCFLGRFQNGCEGGAGTAGRAASR